MWLLSSSKTYASKEVQTVIQRPCQTVVSVKPDQENKKFYSMLEYTPYQDIQDRSVRILNLPKKPRLQFTSGGLDKLHLGNCLYVDDDGLSELCLDLRDRIRKGKGSRNIPFKDVWTQTDLKVYPHILKNDDVANIFTDSPAQTDK